MVEKDKSMEAMIANDEEKEWMTPLLEFRNEFGNEEGDRERRSFRRMHGNLQGSSGRLFHGPYKKEVREEWLEKLLTIQKNINETGPEDFRTLELIRIPELQAIRRIWVFDKHEFDDSLPRIYEEVMSKRFVDPDWIHIDSFGKEEWDLLSSVCYRLYPEQELAFEMMYGLIDIENNSSGLNQRKGIINELEHMISQTYYRDEEDATQYYSNKVKRKDSLDTEYNEKFLDSCGQSDETELDEEAECDN